MTAGNLLKYTVSHREKLYLEIKRAPSGSCNTNWCSIVDALQTSAVEKTNDVRLENLTKLFSLSPDLISL